MTERAKHAAEIRNQRQERGEIRRPSGSSKDTRKWCRGVVGRKHEPELRSYCEVTGASQIFRDWRVVICKNCGKQLEMCYHGRPRKYTSLA